MTKPPIEMILDGIEWTAIPSEDDSGEEHDLPYATHSGELVIAGFTLRCYQLSNGIRVFDAEDLETVLCRVGVIILTEQEQIHKLAPVTREDLEQQAAWKELYAWLLSDAPPTEATTQEREI